MLKKLDQQFYVRFPDPSLLIFSLIQFAEIRISMPAVGADDANTRTRPFVAAACSREAESEYDEGSALMPCHNYYAGKEELSRGAGR
jgi:hypothetical protein